MFGEIEDNKQRLRNHPGCAGKKNTVMNADDFLKLVLKACNHIEARYWMYWNHPYMPQQFAIGFMYQYDVYNRVSKMLVDAGFKRNSEDDGYVIFTIDRSEALPASADSKDRVR